MKTLEQVLKEGNSTENQRIKQRFVDIHVHLNIGSMVDYILSQNDYGKAPFTFDDVENYYSLPELNGKHVSFEGGTEEARNEEIERLQNIIEELETEQENADDEKFDDLQDKIDEIEADIQDLEELESEPQEVFEWWAVSNFLLEKLNALGHPVIEHKNIWGRCTTGQAILLDYAITCICAEMEILEGQTNSWAEK